MSSRSNKLIMVFLLCLLPTVCLAIELEQTYPQLFATQAITKDTSISGLISYLATWAIVIAALAAVVSLIVGGFQYLTSAGMPGAMKDAKERINRALLGLAIVAASYLVLVTVNPQLTVLKIEYVPVETGLFLFTEDGYKEFVQDDGFRKIDDLIKQKKVYALTHDVQDLAASPELGELVVAKWRSPPSLTPPAAEGTAETVNFFNFPLYAIGFWGGLEQDAKVIMYSQENFQGSKYEYTFQGKLDGQGALKRPHGERHGMKLMVFNLDFNAPAGAPDPDFFKTIKKTPTNPGFYVDYVNLKADVYSQKSAQQKERIKRDLELARRLDGPPPGNGYEDVKSRYESDAIDGLIYPPLSLQLRRTGPGVYLYADIAHHNEERKFTESQEDLGGSGVDFSKKAEKIKIVNTKTVLDENGLPIPGAEERYDYLAIVHEDPLYTGNLRLFFEQRLDETEQIPIMCPDGRPWMSQGAVCGYDGFNPSDPNANLETYLSKLAYYPVSDHLVVGNLGEVGDPTRLDDDVSADKSPALIAQKDRYGEVEYVSSMSIFELNPDPKACKEVRLCTEKGFETGETGGGSCISYSYQGANTKTVPEIGVVKYPMPLYQPVNIPKKAKVVKSKDDQGNIAELEDKDFAQEVRSLYIQGDCLVALFENKVEEWDDGSPARGPGPHSQVFFHSKQDLSGYEIGRCGSALRRVAGRHLSKPCAQAIAVFPIVKIEGEGGSAPLPVPSGSSSSCITGQKVTIGTCTGDCCSDANINICGKTQLNCSIGIPNVSGVSKYNTQITDAAAGNGPICAGVDTVKLVKAIMSQESGGDPSADSGHAYGLMQLQRATAEAFKGKCGITDIITKDWLKNEDNAQAQICIAIEFLKMQPKCDCDVRHLAARYNSGMQGNLDACDPSQNCGASGVGGECLHCSGEPFTRRWECLWDNNAHTVCNTGFSETRKYVPKVYYCYSQF